MFYILNIVCDAVDAGYVEPHVIFSLFEPLIPPLEYFVLTKCEGENNQFQIIRIFIAFNYKVVLEVPVNEVKVFTRSKCE